MKDIKRVKIILDVIISALIIAYLIFMPPYISKGLSGNAYNELLEPKKNENGAVISLWHIVEFKPYAGSLGGYFNSYSSTFEKTRFGVFVETTSMSLIEYEERVAAGEKADIYSFPLGLLSEASLRDVDYAHNEFLFNVGKYGVDNGVRFAVPYAVSGSFLVCNSRLIQKDGIKVDMSSADEFIEQAGEQEDFFDEKASMTIMDSGALGAMERRYSTGKGFTFEAYPVKDAKEYVQLIGISGAINESKLQYAYEYINGMFSDENIEKLCGLGLIPTVKPNEYAIAFDNGYVQALYELMCKR